MQGGDWVDPRLGKMTFSTWAKEWERTTVDLRPSTLDLYSYIQRTYLAPTFGAMPMARIGALDVRAWLPELSASDMSAASVHRAFRLLRRIMNVAVQSGVIARSPCVGVRPPSVPRNEMQFCSPEQVVDLAATIDPWYRCMVLTAAYTGLRWGELAGLKRRRVDLLHRELSVLEQMSELNGTLRLAPPKTEAGRRKIRLSPFLVDLLDEQLATRSQSGLDGLVFVTKESEPLRRGNFRRTYWLPATARAGLAGLRFHDLRHTAVALAIANGAHAKAIQQRMGHSSVTITLDRYGHLLPALDDQMADGLERMYRLPVAERSVRAAEPIHPIESRR
jgi:integrase